MNEQSKQHVYLDYAATTPLDPRVREAMEPFFTTGFGNPSSLYDLGIRAKQAVEDSRKRVANVIGAHADEIVFTSGGTEAINLALFGAARSAKKGEFLFSPIEHHAVLEGLSALKAEGFSLKFLRVDEYGLLDPGEVSRALTPATLVVSVMYANNEIGTVEPIEEIGKEISRYKKANNIPSVEPPYFFTDACQAAGALPLAVEKLHVDLMALNGSKIYGPKGIGMLYIRKGVRISPILFGGGQERGLRSGTENVPAIVGFAQALEIANQEREQESAFLSDLRNYCITEIKKKVPEALFNGHPEKRLPNNVNILIPGFDGDQLVLYLDAKGIAVSTGSACTSTELAPSHVLLAIGKTAEEARGSLRITLGRNTKREEIYYFVKTLSETLATLKKR